MVDIVYTTTSDWLEMMGVHFAAINDVCVIEVHWQCGNIIENKFSVMLWYELQKAGVWYIYGHNRGYSHINDIYNSHTNDYVRFWAQYEIFEDSRKDTEVRVQYAVQQGYKKIILLGHSLGASKVVSYLYEYMPSCVVAVILCSPADMVGLAKGRCLNHEDVMQHAVTSIESGNPRAIVAQNRYEWIEHVSAQTYYSCQKEDTSVDCIPIVDKEKPSKALAALTVPVLLLRAKDDHVIVTSIDEDAMILKTKMRNAPRVDVRSVPWDHVYKNNETEYANVIVDRVLSWMQPNNE